MELTTEKEVFTKVQDFIKKGNGEFICNEVFYLYIRDNISKEIERKCMKILRLEKENAKQFNKSKNWLGDNAWWDTSYNFKKVMNDKVEFLQYLINKL